MHDRDSTALHQAATYAAPPAPRKDAFASPRVRARGSEPPLRGHEDLREAAAAAVAELQARELASRAHQISCAVATLRAQQADPTMQIRVRRSGSSLLTAAWVAAALTWIAVTAICLLL
jgi:hypothetical protein